MKISLFSVQYLLVVMLKQRVEIAVGTDERVKGGIELWE